MPPSVREDEEREKKKTKHNKNPKEKMIVQLCQATELPLSPLDHAYPNMFATAFMAAPHFVKQIKLLQPATLSPFHNVGTGRSNFVSCCLVCCYCFGGYRCSLTMERRVNL